MTLRTRALRALSTVVLAATVTTVTAGAAEAAGPGRAAGMSPAPPALRPVPFCLPFTVPHVLPYCHWPSCPSVDGPTSSHPILAPCWPWWWREHGCHTSPPWVCLKY